MTDVTIRGIDDDTYAKFAAEAKRRGMPIGNLATEAMKALVQTASGPSYCISKVEKVEVTREDLESLDGPVRFARIELVQFADDVDWELFKSKVSSIEEVEVVRTGRSLTKLQVLTKSRDVELIDSRR